MNNSFAKFKRNTADAWQIDEDDFQNCVSVSVLKATALDVIKDHHEKESAAARTKIPAQSNQSINNVNQNNNIQLERIPKTPNTTLSLNNNKKNNTAGKNNNQSDKDSVVTNHTTLKPTNGPTTPPSTVSVAAPGMGIRLTSCLLQDTHSDPERRAAQQTVTDAQKESRLKQLIHAPLTDLNELRKSCWSGIPSNLRPVIWKLLCEYLPPNQDRRDSTIQQKRAQYENFVRQYFEAPHVHAQTHTQAHAQTQEMQLQIQKDLTRMNILHKRPRLQQLFERVLFIWSMRHPASGYVQGINDLITPYFLVFLSEFVSLDLNTSGELTLSQQPSEEQLKQVECDCFWCVSRLLDNIQDHYTFAQPGIQLRVGELARLVQRLDNELFQHLAEHRVEFLQFSFRWMNNLLMRELPMRCVIRLWDTYHSEPDAFSHFHVYVCAAFLLRFAADLKSEEDFNGLMLNLQNLPTYHWADEDISFVLADAYRIKCLFRDAPSHL